MEVNKLLFCRFCLKICKDDFVIIDFDIKNMVKRLLPTVDLRRVHEPVVCNSCLHNLQQCLNFKVEFLYRRGFTCNGNKDVNLNASTMNINEKASLAAGPSSGSTVCCLCMAIADFETVTFPKQEEKYLMSKLEKHFLDVDTNITEDPVVCTSCRKNLQSHLTFLNNCVSVEEEMREYCKCVGSKVIKQFELDSLLQFMTNRKLEDYTCMDLNAVKLEEELEKMDNNSSIKVENECCSKIDYQRSDIIKIEHIEIKSEIEDSEDRFSVDVDDVDQSEVETKEADATSYSCKLCAYSAEDKNKLEDHMETHKTVLAAPEFRCDKCTFNTKYKSNLSKHILRHKNESEVTLYHCTECKYYTKIKRYLAKHMLVHNYLSEVKMYKCELCPYETKRKYDLPKHMLQHQPYTDGDKYKCDVCAFETQHRSSLVAHLRTHKNISEVKTYKCTVCPYETRHKHYLPRHVLTHEDRPNVAARGCSKRSAKQV